MLDHLAKQNISKFTIQVLVLFGAFKSMCEEMIVPIDAFIIHLDGLEDNDGVASLIQRHMTTTSRQKMEMSSSSLKHQNDFF
jgi:hypothetical protein